MRISFIILIVGVGLFPLASLFTHLDTSLTNEIWEGPKYEPIGKMILNSGESYSFDFTVLDKTEIILSMKIQPKDAALTTQFFSQDGELIYEMMAKDRTAHAMFVQGSKSSSNAPFEYGETYTGILENLNNNSVNFESSILTTETPPRPTDYGIFRSLALELFMLPIPVLILGSIVFFAEWKYKKQVKQP